MIKIKRYWFYCIALLLFSCGADHEGSTIIYGVDLFDGKTVHQNVSIVFSKDIIDEIAEGEIDTSGAKVIDGRGKFVVPPLLNAHVHVWDTSHLHQALNNGVFALLDMHNTDRQAWLLKKYRDSLHYAYLYSSGPGATVPGGHGTQFGIKVPTINDAVDGRKFVEDRVKYGADYIKILRDPYLKTISFDQTKAVIETAHQKKKLCVAHIANVQDAVRLADQGIDGFVHIWGWGKIKHPELVKLVKKKVFIVPTLLVIKKAYEAGDYPDSLNNGFENVLGEVKKVYDNGIIILAGTDPPNFGINYGSDLFTELELLSQAGIPNIEVLKSVTSNISTCFKLKEFGLLSKGKPASFILIKGDPTKNISDMRNMVYTWKNGIRVK